MNESNSYRLANSRKDPIWGISVKVQKEIEPI
jgi:hypothetical protein